MVVLTTDSWPGGGQSVPSVVRPCSCSTLITLHIGAPEEGLWSSSFSLLLHAFASLAVIRCCLQSKITGAGVNPNSLFGAPCRVVCSAPRINLACRLRRSWRSSRLPTTPGSHGGSLPYSATAWLHATSTPHTLSRMTPEPQAALELGTGHLESILMVFSSCLLSNNYLSTLYSYIVLLVFFETVTSSLWPSSSTLSTSTSTMSSFFW